MFPSPEHSQKPRLTYRNPCITDLRIMKSVSSTEVARNLGECLALVRHTGEPLLICRKKTPIAILSPVPGSSRVTVEEFIKLWTDLPFDPAFGTDLEKVNREDQPLENPWGS